MHSQDAFTDSRDSTSDTGEQHESSY